MSRPRGVGAGCVEATGTRTPVWKCHYHFYELQSDGTEKRKHKTFTLERSKYTKDQAYAVLSRRKMDRRHEVEDEDIVSRAMDVVTCSTMESSGYIYGLVSREGRCLKIGYSTEPETRKRHLQTANAHLLRFCFLVRGTISEERQLHDILKGHRALNEWYLMTPTIEGFLRRLGEIESAKSASMCSLVFSDLREILT